MHLYIEQPIRFTKINKDHMRKLKQSLYKTLVLGNLWNNTLQSYLKKLKFVELEIDPYLLRVDKND
jgi:hypothetical protein